MVSNEFAEAASEINLILTFMPKSYIDKVPEKLKDFFNEVASKTYKPNIDPSIDLDKQELKEKTKDILAMLYMNYWCSDEQKAKMKEQMVSNDNDFENTLKEKYDINIFEDKKKIEKIEKEEKKEEKKENLSLQVKQDHWYTKIIENISKWIKSIFKK